MAKDFGSPIWRALPGRALTMGKHSRIVIPGIRPFQGITDEHVIIILEVCP